MKVNAKQLAETGGGLVLANAIENMVLGGYAAPGAEVIAGFAAKQFGFHSAGNVLLVYGALNAAKRVLVKSKGSIMDSVLPGNTNRGEGAFAWKLGAGSAMKSLPAPQNKGGKKPWQKKGKGTNGFFSMNGLDPEEVENGLAGDFTYSPELLEDALA